MATGTFCWVWNAKKIVGAAQMKAYGETYLRRYEHLVQSKVLPAYRKYFSFLKEKPILIKASISTSHGAAMEFISSEKQKFQCQIVSDRIEQEIFSDKDINIPRIKPDANNTAIINYTGLGPCIKNSAQHNTLSNFAVNTPNGSFLEVSETGSIVTKKLIVNGIAYPNTIIIKGSNRRSAWNRKSAKEDVLDEFHLDFQFAYFTSEEFRRFVATPQLTHITNEITRKQKAGDYGVKYGYLLFQEDLAKLNAAADAHRIKHEFTENILAFSKEQPSWRERHPIIFTLILTFLGAFLIWFLKWGWKWSWVKLGR